MDRWKKWAVFCAAAVYLAVYIFVSYRNLLVFPFVHSDESWLAGLSRDMLAAGNLGVTESFFDAKPRVPHAMKSLFHLMQMGAVGLGGFSVGSVRMLSLLAGIICLVLFYLCVRRMGSRWFALGLTVLLSLDICAAGDFYCAGAAGVSLDSAWKKRAAGDRNRADPGSGHRTFCRDSSEQLFVRGGLRRHYGV